MSYMTAETDDEILSREYSGSPSTDEGNGSGTGLKKGPWTSAEDAILMDYVHKHGEGNWNVVQKHSGLSRCGKSCRLRWANHLRPNLKKGAFTPEEERLIIELHAKMGNKWARMAAQLPGRTDNEIKNYWNTRMKRRQRAGLPLYPLDFCFQQMQESQVNQNDSLDSRQNDNLQPNHYEIPDITFDHLKDTRGVSPYIPEIPCISPSSMLLNTLNPSGYYGFIPPIVHRPKRPREAAPSFFEYSKQQPMDDNCGDLNSQSFGSSFSYDPNPMNRYILPSGENQGFRSHNNGKFSAFELSSRATSKLELSSFQNPETDFTSWEFSSPPALCDSVDAFIQSPPHSPKNSGLLDALLHEAKIKSSNNLQLSQKSLNFNALIPDDKTNYSGLDISEKIWTEYGDSMSPLGNSSASIFSDCTPLSVNGSPLDENYPAETLPGNNINSEAGEQVWRMETKKKENEAKLDYSRPDALLGSCWFGQGFAHQKDQVPKTDYISASAHNDLAYDDKLIPVTTSPNQGWELSSYPWNSMPAVCHIS